MIATAAFRARRGTYLSVGTIFPVTDFQSLFRPHFERLTAPLSPGVRSGV